MAVLPPLLLAGAALAAPTVAQAEPSGTAFEFARESVASPFLASAENGRALATWRNGSGAGARVLGRTSTLTPRVSLASGTDTGPPVIAANPGTGQYLRVWAEFVDDPCCLGLRNYKVYSQKQDRNGAPVASRSVVIEMTVDGAMEPNTVVWNPRTRQYLLLYGIGDEGYSQLATLALNEAGAPVPASGTDMPTSSFGSPTLALRPKDGTYLVAWAENGTLRGQVLSSDGRLAGAAFTVTRHANLAGQVDNDEPAIAVDPVSNESVVAWSDRYEVFARRITATGSVTGSDLWLSRMGPSSDPAWLTRSPAIAYSPGSQQYLVVWQSGPGKEPYPAGEGVYGQHLNRSGGQIGTNDFPISTLDRAVDPAVTSFTGGTDFLVAWSSRRSSPSAWARRVTRTP